MKKTIVVAALLGITLTCPGLTAYPDSIGRNAESAYAANNEDTILYENTDIGFKIEIPRSWEGKYNIVENEINILRGNTVSIYHKATAEELEGGGWLGSFGRAPGYYTAEQPPVMAGWCPILGYKNGFTYYFQNPSDVQYSLSDEGELITEAAKEYVEMRNRLEEIMESLTMLDTWIEPAGSGDMSGMNLYSQDSIDYFAGNENAVIYLYTSAEQDDNNNFMFDDRQDWLLLMETSSGVYPLFPRTPVQLGKVSCSVFNVYDEDLNQSTTVLITVEQSAMYMIYECAFDSERNAFKLSSVYNKYINYFKSLFTVSL